MLFRYVSKPILVAAAAAAGLVYIVAEQAWKGLDEAAYMNPFLLTTVYIFYVWLIMPFNVKYVFAVVRNPDQIEYKLIFLVKLTSVAALYECILTVELGIIGLVTGDDFIAVRVINYLVHLFLNLIIFNTLYIALCDKIKSVTARTTSFFLPVIGIALNHFGGDTVHKLNFPYFGMHNISIPNAAIVYIAVFGGCLFLIFMKGKREYV